MEFKVLNKLEELVSLKDEWNELVYEMDNPQVFYKWEWLFTYLEEVDFEYKNNLNIILTYDKKKLIAIFPLLNDTGTLRFITNKTVDYNNFYIDKKSNKYTVIEKTIQYIINNINFKDIILNNIQGKSELFILNDILINKYNYFTILEESVMAPTLINGIENESKYRIKQIKDIDRRKRKINDSLICEFNCDLDDETYNFLKSNHKKKWEKSVFNNQRYINFYRKLNKNMKENFEISRLKLDNKIVAAHMGFKDDNKVYYYIPIYDEDYSNKGVGYILLKELIDTYKDKKEFDFLRGNENYKFNWTDNINMNYNFYATKSKVTSFITYIKVYFKKSKFLRKVLNK
ncbi:GNAT family N-acetyltransferase [Clostridium baratii]|uniref:GNAT family N-acetyltransferase n=1 Tax=Clostridium baratii TaxID=1561 RepID=UPI0030D17DE6